MGSSFYSPFLPPSLQSGRMSLKGIVVLCMVLVGSLEANPVRKEEHNNSVSGDSVSEEIIDNGEQGEHMSREAGAVHREKRACANWNHFKRCCHGVSCW